MLRITSFFSFGHLRLPDNGVSFSGGGFQAGDGKRFHTAAIFQKGHVVGHGQHSVAAPDRQKA